jgi:hypothetical protein
LYKSNSSKTAANGEFRSFWALTDNLREISRRYQMAESLDDAIDTLFEGAVAVSTPRAFRALDVGTTKGHELLNSGALKSVKIGRARRVYVASIKALLAEGVPLVPKAKPASTPHSPPARVIKRPS